MKVCRSKLSALIETKQIERTQEAANWRSKLELPNAAFAKASALPSRKQIRYSVTNTGDDAAVDNRSTQLKDHFKETKVFQRRQAQAERLQSQQRNLAPKMCKAT